MGFKVFLFLLIFQISSTVSNKTLNNSERIQVFNNITYEYGKQYNIQFNRSVEYIFEYSQSKLFDSEYPARISISSNSANTTFPIFIMARQQKGVLSWQLPLIIDGREVSSVSRTLCPNKNFFLESRKSKNNSSDNGFQNHPIIHISTSSIIDINYTLKVDLVQDFYLNFNTFKKLTASPSEPIIYFYSFESGLLNGVLDLESVGDTKKPLVTIQKQQVESDLNNNTKSNNSYYAWEYARNVFKKSMNKMLDETKKTVLIQIDSNDDICMLISIQNASCPVFDTERDISYEGFYASASRKGGITVTQDKYPLGFYVVLVIKANDYDCGALSKNASLERKSSFFTWKVSDFDQSRWTVINRMARVKEMTLTILPSISYRDYWIGVVLLISIIVGLYLIFLVGLICHRNTPMSMEFIDGEQVIGENGNCDNVDSPTLLHSALDIAATNFGIRRTRTTSMDGTEIQQVYVNELCKRDVAALTRQSNQYLWNVITVAVFYGLPVVQLVITYQRVLNRTGDQDQCYYNFLCAHPLGLLSDFNHVFSNLGYVLLGFLFIIFVWKRMKMHQDVMFDKHFGIPQHNGLCFAMGIGLMMEGVLSGSYHVCPNHTNFQFDTSFMYIIAVLCMVKIYQSRHPDINARAHVTFGVLACAVFIGLMGVLFPNIYIWVGFTFIHVVTCLVLTLQIYYMGRLQIKRTCFVKCMCGGVCRPAFQSRCIFLVLANLCNWGLAGFGVYRHSKDFASHLLWVFLMNLALHLFWYIIMKLVHREYPRWYCWVLFFLACLAWGGALYFFIDNSTSWALTPAQSRTFNKHCAIVSFYDNHDIWHLLSAAAMFFSFMLFLTIDDDISHVARGKIPVF